MAFSEITESLDKKANELYEARAPRDLCDFELAMWFWVREAAQKRGTEIFDLSQKAIRSLSKLDDYHLELLSKGGWLSFGLTLDDFDLHKVLGECSGTNMFVEDVSIEEPLVRYYWQVLKIAVDHDKELASQLCGVSPAIMQKLSIVSLSELFVIASKVECLLSLRFSEQVIFDILSLQIRKYEDPEKCTVSELQDLEADLIAKKTIQILTNWISRFGSLAGEVASRVNADMSSWKRKAVARFLLVAGFSIDAVIPHVGMGATSIRNLYDDMSPETVKLAEARKKREDYRNVLCNAGDLMLASLGALCYRTYLAGDIETKGIEIPTMCKAFKLYTASLREWPTRSTGWRDNAMPVLHSLLLYIVNSEAWVDECLSCKSDHYVWIDQSTVRSCPFCKQS
ncbi:hypothetical protein [Pseudovibrio sp. Ad37]|uniref:hypothetical protein n=1 Tax=Pseudovibrio sp. Ad37 TaxID=989422 RepID=UPI0007AE9DC0|nr:hypothetical protein [Pseudovibrio sp. Ad37]KZL24222.1 hypothetical protein PsAD37_02793 [Pseudovibrio sp. Ad37]